MEVDVAGSETSAIHIRYNANLPHLYHPLHDVELYSSPKSNTKKITEQK